MMNTALKLKLTLSFLFAVVKLRDLGTDCCVILILSDSKWFRLDIYVLTCDKKKSLVGRRTP